MDEEEHCFLEDELESGALGPFTVEYPQAGIISKVSVMNTRNIDTRDGRDECIFASAYQSEGLLYRKVHSETIDLAIVSLGVTVLAMRRA